MRDTSKSRRDLSTVRRDRERGEHDDRDRENRRTDRRGEREDRSRSDRWVDDGKWEERLEARRRDRDDERPREKDRNGWREVGDKDAKDRNSDKRTRSDRDKERARSPLPPDDKQERTRRSGREKKEDAKEKEDRKEREKEKEPAWMETYVPSDTNIGIFGGQTTDGQIDSIQAWKKGMQAKERKEKPDNGALDETDAGPPPSVPPKAISEEGQMDEIQLFKMMIQREQQRSNGDGSSGDHEGSAMDTLNGTAGGMSCVLQLLFVYSNSTQTHLRFSQTQRSRHSYRFINDLDATFRSTCFGNAERRAAESPLVTRGGNWQYPCTV